MARVTWVVELGDDGVVAVADELRRGAGHRLLGAQQEAPAPRPVLLARKGCQTGQGSQQGCQGDQGDQPDILARWDG